MIDIIQRTFKGFDEFKIGKASINPTPYNYYSKSTPSLFKQVSSTSSRKEMITRARKYVWDIGILYRIIKMKVDFISAGFKLVHKDEDILKLYEDIYYNLDIETFIRNAAFEHEVIGEWYPFWSWEGSNPAVATILNPDLVEVKSLFGKEMIFLKPSIEIQKMIERSKDDPDIRKRLIKQIPVKFLRKWNNGESVLLDEDMCQRYTNLKAYHEQYANSPLRPIFGDLELLQTLIEGDYATAYKIKKAILQVKVGDKDFNEGSAVDSSLFDQAEELWSNPSQAMEVYTQWFMSADWIVPDVDIFDSEKYKEVYRRILDWSGINVMIDDGGSFAQGFIKVKGLKQDVQKSRDEIKRSLDKFNRLIAEKKGLTTYRNKLKVPEVKFDSNALTDPKEIKNLVEFLYNHGLLSAEEALNEFGYNLETQMKKKRRENKEFKDDMVVIFEPSQSNSLHSKEQKKENSTQPTSNNKPSN